MDQAQVEELLAKMQQLQLENETMMKYVSDLQRENQQIRQQLVANGPAQTSL